VKIRSVRVELLHAADRHNEANSRFSQCCQRVSKRIQEKYFNEPLSFNHLYYEISGSCIKSR